MKRILITVGGTGGHVYPAVALAKQLDETPIEYLFVGGNLSNNAYFDRNFPHKSVSCSTLSLSRPWKIPFAMGKIAKGIAMSKAIIEEFSPDVVVGFGSYYTLPTLIAAKLHGTPFVLHEANSIAGKVNRLMAPYAAAVVTHFPGTDVRGNVQEARMPVRFKKGSVSREVAFAYFGLKEGIPVVLIFGGSQGASVLNRIIPGGHQVIHLTGGEVATLQKGYREVGMRAAVKAFEPRMDYAFEIADAVVSRAGASTLAEIMEYEVPSLLVPFARATDNHQEKNARYISDTVCGGLLLLEKDVVNMASFLKDLLRQRAKFKENLAKAKAARVEKDLLEIIMGIK